MSRIGRLPVALPKTVKASIIDNVISIEGPKGKLSQAFNPALNIEIGADQIVVSRTCEEKAVKAAHGLTRQLIANMIKGVSEGYQKNLSIVGVGYKVEKSGKNVVFSLGYANDIEFVIPAGVEIVLDGPNKVMVKGIDKQLVGQTAAEIRSLRRPEPYKGKGIRYEDEVVRAKSGKSGKA